MRGLRCCGGSDAGFTIAEVVIASSILLVCLTSLGGVLSGSVTSSSVARIRDEATNLANERIEIARSLAYDRVGLHYANGVYGDPAGDIVTPERSGKFTVTTECTWVRTATGRAAYKQVTVHVAWAEPTPGEVVVTTMITGKSNLATNGDLLVLLRYREDATPVQGATVAVHAADNSDRSVVSNATGEGFFGQVAVGAVALTVTPPIGCIVDTSTISTMSVAADAVTTIVAYIQKPAQATIHVTDTSGTAIAGASVVLRRADGVLLPAVLTDASGDAVVAQLLYGDYSATITKAGYPPTTVPVTVSVTSPQPVVPVSISPLVGVGLQVRVFDVNGTPVPGSTITVHLDGSTNPALAGAGGTNGEVSFSGMSAGSYSATVDKAGYVSQAKATYVRDGDHIVLDFILVPIVAQGSMQVTTRDDNNTATSLRVVLTWAGGSNDNLYSDANGILLLQNLVPGSYKVKCYKKAASTATVIVNGGQTSYIQISQN
jgi:type II secretory pathway pseudopilin PulG